HQDKAKNFQIEPDADLYVFHGQHCNHAAQSRTIGFAIAFFFKQLSQFRHTQGTVVDSNVVDCPLKEKIGFRSSLPADVQWLCGMALHRMNGSIDKYTVDKQLVQAVSDDSRDVIPG